MYEKAESYDWNHAKLAKLFCIDRTCFSVAYLTMIIASLSFMTIEKSWRSEPLSELRNKIQSHWEFSLISLQ